MHTAHDQDPLRMREENQDTSRTYRIRNLEIMQYIYPTIEWCLYTTKERLIYPINYGYSMNTTNISKNPQGKEAKIAADKVATLEKRMAERFQRLRKLRQENIEFAKTECWDESIHYEIQRTLDQQDKDEDELDLARAIWQEHLEASN